MLISSRFEWKTGYWNLLQSLTRKLPLSKIVMNLVTFALNPSRKRAFSYGMIPTSGSGAVFALSKCGFRTRRVRKWVQQFRTRVLLFCFLFFFCVSDWMSHLIEDASSPESWDQGLKTKRNECNSVPGYWNYTSRGQKTAQKPKIGTSECGFCTRRELFSPVKMSATVIQVLKLHSSQGTENRTKTQGWNAPRVDFPKI